VLATLAAAALICAASLAVGEAVAQLLGRDRWRGWSPAVGFGLLLVAATLSVKLPGHGSTGAAICGLLVVAAATVVWRNGLRAPDPDAAAATLAVLGFVLVPFLSSGRFGVLGMSFLNDMSAHLAWAETFKDPSVAGSVMTPGYPAGPHSLVATVSSGSGIGVEPAFNGLLIAIQILIAWTVLPLLDGLARWRRALGATIVATCFLLSAFYAQASFKETAVVLFLLAAVALLRGAARDWSTATLGTGIQAGALVAGTIFSYSYSGLAWLFLAVGIWGVLELVAALLEERPRAVATRVRAALSPRRGPLALLIGAAVTGALLALPDVGRLLDALNLFGSSPSGTGVIASNSLAHLAGPLSPYSIFGLFPAEDFRFPLPQQYRYGALIGLGVAATAFGALWWILRRDLLVPATAAAAALIAIYLRYEESPYLTSKGYAVLAPLAMLLAVRALLEPWPASVRLPALRIARGAVAALFCAVALYSGYKVLHGAEVGTPAHTKELAEIGERVRGEPTLFLGFDDFVAWRLHGAPVALPVQGFHLAGSGQTFEAVPEKAWAYGDPFDFDSVPSADLDDVRYVVATRSRNQSTPPPNFRPVASTQSFVVYERRGPTRARRILGEGRASATLLDCSTPAGRALSRRTGWAAVVDRPIVALPIGDQRYADPGDRRTIDIRLPRGRWELSMQYVAEQDIEIGGLDSPATLPATLDRPGPWYRIGDVTQRRPGVRTLTFDVGDAPLPASTHVSELIAVAAVDLDSPPLLLPLREACGLYIDWYTLGPKRPAVPANSR
jgi:hypothetical protein